MVLRRTLICLLGLTFFGLTPDYRVNLFEKIHEIVFFGKGGYDWNTVYNMPIWLRNFTFKKIKEFYDETGSNNDTVEKSIAAMKAAGADKKLNPPSYVTKALKK
jgi:hypothetical protein